MTIDRTPAHLADMLHDEQVEHETLFNTVTQDLPQLEDALSQELLRYQLR